MNITRFALGMRFSALAQQPPEEFARKVFEGIFSLLTLSELEGLCLYGGEDPFSKSEPQNHAGDVYLAVIMGGSLKVMRKVYAAISNDAALDMYLVHNMPFVENNRLATVEGLNYLGKIRPNGKVEGGDGTLDGLTVPKKRGSKKPVGKNIRVLLAPMDYKSMSAAEAIQRMSVAARRHFQGIKLAPFPMSTGAGFAASLSLACSGTVRRTSFVGQNGKVLAEYGVIRGKTAVMDTAFGSIGTGELIRRALDEGLKSIILGVGDNALEDGGMGLARSLGIRFFDENNEELDCDKAALPRIHRAEGELLHPGLSAARILLMDNSPALTLIDGADKLCAALGTALEKNIDPKSGVIGIISALCPTFVTKDYGELLTKLEITKLLRGTALVVTGCTNLDDAALGEGAPIYALAKTCAKLHIPLAAVVYEQGAPAALTAANIAITSVKLAQNSTPEQEISAFDEAVDSMFGLIRMGRDVEKIGAPKRRRAKSWVEMLIESRRHKDI